MRIIVRESLLYLILSIVIMASGQWKKPQSFYLKYEGAAIEHEIGVMKGELEYINNLKMQLGMVEE